MFQCRHRYIIHRHINTNTDIMKARCHIHSFAVKIYNRLPKKKNTQVVYCVEFPNVSKITYTSLPFTMVKPP